MASGESKLIHLIEDDVVPALEAELADLAGVEIIWLVDWASFEANMSALHYLEDHGLARIMEALRDYCVEEDNADLLATLVGTILVRNVESEGDMGVSYADKVLTITGAWHLEEDGWPDVEDLHDDILDTLQDEA